MTTLHLQDKLPHVGTTIFTTMSQLAHAHGAINLAQGFPSFDTPEPLKALTQHYISVGYNQYAPMPGHPKLTHQIAQSIALLYGAVVDPAQEITVTNGASQAIFTAMSAFVHRGDEVILLEPAYDCYRPAIELNGGVPVVYEMLAPDFRVDWEAVAQLITSRTRMIVVNTPHNPTATTFTPDDWAALRRIVASTSILVLSDEVYAHITYDGAPHESILRYPDLWARTIATYSFGKTFHNTGWKTGYIVAPAPLMTLFRKVHQYNVFSVHTPTQLALADYLQDPDTYLSLPDFYAARRDRFQNALAGSAFRLLPSAGSYFMLADYSAISDKGDTEFAVWLTKTVGVAAIPVSAFYSNRRDNHLIRFCFAKSPEMLEAAAQRLCGL